MNNALDDEITSINSIYSEQTFLPSPTEQAIWTIRIPSVPSITLRCHFPSDYPDAPPTILGTETIGSDASKGLGARVIKIGREVLENVYRPGEPCVFDLLEEFAATFEPEPSSEEAKSDECNSAQNTKTLDKPQFDKNLGTEPPWFLSKPIIEKKSVFVARAASVSSPQDAEQYLRHLLATDKKVAKATHNITAWRIRGSNETSYQDFDDDGETAAGSRVLHLMQLMDVWDVMVIITRWYGGILLGPDRFRIINTAAREALVAGGFAKDGRASKRKGKK